MGHGSLLFPARGRTKPPSRRLCDARPPNPRRVGPCTAIHRAQLRRAAQSVRALAQTGREPGKGAAVTEHHADADTWLHASRNARRRPSGPPRPGAARRRAGPWRAQLASTPGRTACTSGGAAPHPLWLAQSQEIIYPELDAIGNVRHVHAGLDPAKPTFRGDLGGYSYSAFGKTLRLSDPGGLAPPSGITQPFQWQGKRLIAPNLYDSRARVWSADLGAFLQPDEYGFLSRGGTLWSWPGQNPYRWICSFVKPRTIGSTATRT
jgi:RHS repeat-associated protein